MRGRFGAHHYLVTVDTVSCKQEKLFKIDLIWWLSKILVHLTDTGNGSVLLIFTLVVTSASGDKKATPFVSAPIPLNTLSLISLRVVREMVLVSKHTFTPETLFFFSLFVVVYLYVSALD